MELSDKLVALATEIGANFTLKGRPVPHTEVFADTGLLPGLTKRADQLASLCLGYGLGATYVDTEKTLLGVKVTFDTATPDVLRLFCILDVIVELVKSSPSKSTVPLDELMYD
ncbi:MAG: type IV secretion protein IcmS [Gammaproteobacteria bacterium RIFCSPHIGHO2_12_FULL_41_15]|nr:MAG: type IV secretion protein IcmS [Gammaproteobacteria bacterium RIFCSPHIGHO2_12_FULL_41_15]